MSTHIVHADPTLTGANQVEDDESAALVCLKRSAFEMKPNTKSQQQTSTSYVESGNMQLSQAEVIVDDSVEMSQVHF